MRGGMFVVLSGKEAMLVATILTHKAQDVFRRIQKTNLVMSGLGYGLVLFKAQLT